MHCSLCVATFFRPVWQLGIAALSFEDNMDAREQIKHVMFALCGNVLSSFVAIGECCVCKNLDVHEESL